jgi:hypothetical protein
MSGLFDPTSFLNSPLAESNATKREPLPAADAVPAQVIAQDMKNGTKDNKPWYKLEVKLEITDPEYLAQVAGDPKPEKVVITYGVMLELTEAGTIAMGPNKNVNLGKLREATGVNMPGKALSDMVGKMIRAKIGHRPDSNDASIVYEDVKGVIPY